MENLKIKSLALLMVLPGVLKSRLRYATSDWLKIIFIIRYQRLVGMELHFK